MDTFEINFLVEYKVIKECFVEALCGRQVDVRQYIQRTMDCGSERPTVRGHNDL